jgi:2-succinyl-5-enolpyruvyl-6-hydroxy-3-cyclohexene-1-carboxylate synthase
VALAHDIGGLLSTRRLGLGLTIVLLNNDGGGIFHFLPVARLGAVFEEHVATPHGLDFAHAAALYGCGYERPGDLAQLEAAVRRSLDSPGTQIIEVRTDRHENLALHRSLTERVIAALTTGDNF